MGNLNQFSHLYPLSKTLSMALIPQGKTLEHIQSAGILARDEHRSGSYKIVKQIIDRYHRDFIESALGDFKLEFDDNGKKSSLTEYAACYNAAPSEERNKDLETLQDSLRKQIAAQLVGQERYKRIDKKELIEEDLQEYLKDLSDVEKAQIDEFKGFTTYFTGFYQNRQNMYSSEAISTAIAFRLIHQNLPRFMDNLTVFAKLKDSPVAASLQQLYNDFEAYLNVSSIDEIFRLDYYSDLLTQKQIDVYNAIIGGKSIDERSRIQGLNEYINLYNQQQADKSTRLPKFKPLYKQILSDREAISFLPESFESDNETLECIEKLYENLHDMLVGNGEGSSLKTLLRNLHTYNIDKIYIANDLQLTEISQRIFGSYDKIQNAIETVVREENPQKGKEKDDKYNERIKKLIKAQRSYSIKYINNCLLQAGSANQIDAYYADLGAINSDSRQEENLFAKIDNAYTLAKDLLNTPYPETLNLAQDKESVSKIKNLLDAYKDLQRYIKPLLGAGDESDKDELFYGEFMAMWDALDVVTPIYNKVRNYLTRKPYSNEKIKLNFDNSQLLGGWDANKEKDCSGIIMRKNGLFYLVILKKGEKNLLESKYYKEEGECYEKMEYKLLPGPNKMLPKVFFSKSRIAEFAPSETIIKHYKEETHKKGPKFNLKDCHELIDFFKQSIAKHEDWKNFGFKFSDTESYEDLSGFYREVEKQGYMMSFRKVPVAYVDQLVNEGKIYLFQIYNKDFSPFSKGTPNMHTLYWKAVFSDENLRDVVYKLNGQAEVFFRKSSIREEQKIVHPAHHPVENKSSETQKVKPTSLFDYDLVKDRRYTVDQFSFHVPITLNFKSTGTDNINQNINECIKHGGIRHIIGIDRGERHLLYLTMIDLKGNVVQQFTLNQIINEYNGVEHKIDYHELLAQKEEERTAARRSWKTIENIKELKEGYLSQVVHKICQMVVEYDAIVVLEDLNMGFMRGRQKVEKQVYQKFEKMLIDKLNYLVDKKADMNAPGGLLHALQLTSKFDSFQKMGKQSGVLFYIPAWNTSKMDPTTGFVNLFSSADLHYESVEKAKAFISKFESIRYNSDKNWFEFSFDYNKFGSKAEGTQTHWTLYTYGTRIKTFRNKDKNSQWDSVELDLTTAWKDFFVKNHGFDLKGNLKEQINEQMSKDFFENLLYLMNLTLQMRNSMTGTEVDYLISPIAGPDGTFFDSRKCGDKLPANADANGAYNIARKGLWVVSQIQEATDLAKFRIPAMTNKEWLQYAQEKPYLK